MNATVAAPAVVAVVEGSLTAGLPADPLARVHAEWRRYCESLGYDVDANRRAAVEAGEARAAVGGRLRFRSPAPIRSARPAACDSFRHIAAESPATGRAGWIRSDCRDCGRFIGYRPAGTR